MLGMQLSFPTLLQIDNFCVQKLIFIYLHTLFIYAALYCTQFYSIFKILVFLLVTCTYFDLNV